MSKPKIRFKGFDGDWESGKLGDIADKINTKNTEKEITEVFTNSASLGVVSQKDYFNHDIAKQENINGYYLICDGDFVYNPRISVTSPVGPISQNKLGRTGAMSPLYTIFRTHEVDKAYLEQYFKTSLWHSYMKYNGNTGARFDRFSISMRAFFSMPIPMPEIDEQSSIANMIESVDSLISTSQDKINRLKSLKICYLSQLFPIGGVPSRLYA